MLRAFLSMTHSTCFKTSDCPPTVKPPMEPGADPTSGLADCTVLFAFIAEGIYRTQESDKAICSSNELKYENKNGILSKQLVTELQCSLHQMTDYWMSATTDDVMIRYLDC